MNTAPPAPVVRIGGIDAAVTFAGPAPGFAGLDQINVTVPLNAPVGESVRVDLLVGMAAANSPVLAVAL